MHLILWSIEFVPIKNDQVLNYGNQISVVEFKQWTIAGLNEERAFGRERGLGDFNQFGDWNSFKLQQVLTPLLPCTQRYNINLIPVWRPKATFLKCGWKWIDELSPSSPVRKLGFKRFHRSAWNLSLLLLLFLRCIFTILLVGGATSGVFKIWAVIEEAKWKRCQKMYI